MATKHNTHPDVPAEVRGVIKKIRHAQPGFDVVRGWVDSPSPNIEIAEIGKLCGGGADLSLGSMRFGARWCSHFELRQPSSEAFALFHDAVGQRYSVHPSYAEVAWDCITTSQADADVVAAFLLGHLYVPYLRHEVEPYNGTTWYWNPRANASGDRFARNVVLYASKPSKQAGRFVGRPCAHLEFRLDGGAELAKVGLVGFDDLLRFDHLAFWEKQVRLLRPKSLADLGRWLEGEASGTMLRKRAHAFRDDFSTSGVFVLQNALLDNRKLMKVLRPLNSRQVLLGRKGMVGT